MESDRGFKSWQRLPVRVLICVDASPPQIERATPFGRLVHGIHPDDYRVCPVEVPSGSVSVRGRTRSLDDPPSDTLRAADAIVATCQAQDCRIIIAGSGTMARLLAPVAARLAGVPFVLWVADGSPSGESDPAAAGFGESLEREVFAAAAAIVAPHELLADAIARLCGVRPVVIRPSVDDALIASDAGDHRRKKWRRMVITGCISPAMADALSHVSVALKRSDLRDVRLHSYGPQSAAELGALGIDGGIAVHPWLAAPEKQTALRAADALLLPLPFRSAAQDLVYHPSASLAAYLASGRPLLIHAPPGSFPAWYCRQHECGLIVETPDALALARAIRLLREDAELCRRLGEHALARAREDFAASRAHQMLTELLQRVVANP